MNIHHLLQKIKSKLGSREVGEVEVIGFNESGEVEALSGLRPYFATLVVILALTLSFGLGRLSAPTERAGIQIEYDPELASMVTTQAQLSGTNQSATVVNSLPSTSVIGSSKGTKYHFSHCPGAKQITEANKIVFRSPEDAEKAGYTLAANCKPR